MRRDGDGTKRLRPAAFAAAIVLVSGSVAACSSESGQAAGSSATGSPELTGTYTFVTDGSQLAINGGPREGGASSTTTWVITPCGAGCSHVTSSLGWDTDFRLVDRTWQATREIPLDCAGSTVASTITYKLNADTLTGTVTNDIPCGQPPSVAVLPATLTQK